MMPEDAHGGVVVQYPTQTLFGPGRPIGHDHHARMLCVAHPDTPTVVKGNPRCPSGHIAH